MKTKILILEDNYERFFVTKQFLEAKLKIKINVEGAATNSDLVEKTNGVKPCNIFHQRHHEDLMGLMARMERKKINRLNSEVTLLVTNYETLESFVNADTLAQAA